MRVHFWALVSAAAVGSHGGVVSGLQRVRLFSCLANRGSVRLESDEMDELICSVYLSSELIVIDTQTVDEPGVL